MKSLTEDEVSELRCAASELDALWDLRAAVGSNDARPGAEYDRLSVAPLLRRIAEEAE
jgi:hypothetical protein